MPEGGTLRLLTLQQDVAPESAQRHEVQPGTYCVVRVSDTGIGMGEETMGQIFEPFFSTKTETGGTGLGLAMVYGFVRQSAGYIEVESSPGNGTTITLSFPTVDAQVQDVGGEEKRGAGFGTLTGKLLVVEDNDSVRRVVVKVLERIGVEVIEARSVEEALEQLERSTDIDAVLTDLILPGKSGRYLVDHLRESHPGVAAIVMSGYSADSPGHRGDLPPDIPFIQKPFTPADLVESLRAVLGTT
jgi:CheY-like chemotaxis protein